MKDKLISISVISVGILSIGIIFVVFATHIFPVISPFVIAWLLAAATASPARKLSSRIKAPEKIIRLVMSVVATLFIFSALALFLWQGTAALWGFLSDIASKNRLYDLITTLFKADAPLLGDYLPHELASKISEALGRLVSSCLTLLAEWVTSIVGAIPQFFLFILVTLISLVYFALDYDRINSFVIRLLPKRIVDILAKMKESIFNILKKYILSYSLIMLITYLTLLSGLWLLRVDHAPIIALFIAALDILPILGVGTVLVPWSILELVMGNRFLGIGLIILFVVNAIIRQLSEPKIVGKSLNLHPLITLMMIYVGYALFGFVGMIILPVASVILGSILKQDNSAEVT